jgi:polar amino acid transport system substrate-binding protein
MRNMVLSMMAGAAALLMLGSAQAADGVDAI